MCFALLVGVPVTLSGAQPVGPAGVARLQREEASIEARFVERVAGVTGISVTRIADLLPPEPRIADRATRLIQAIGRDIRLLSAEEQSAIREADEARKGALARLHIGQ